MCRAATLTFRVIPMCFSSFPPPTFPHFPHPTGPPSEERCVPDLRGAQRTAVQAPHYRVGHSNPKRPHRIFRYAFVRELYVHKYRVLLMLAVASRHVCIAHTCVSLTMLPRCLIQHSSSGFRQPQDARYVVNSSTEQSPSYPGRPRMPDGTTSASPRHTCRVPQELREPHSARPRRPGHRQRTGEGAAAT